jgi:hypothetical protein
MSLGEGLAAGDYAVGFSLSDDAHQRSWWGMPDVPESRPIPGGPVTLTVTAD